MKILAGILGGLIVAILAMMLTGLATAGSSPKGSGGGTVFFLAWAAGIAIAVMAPHAAKAWRRLLLTSAVLSFMLPLAGIVFTGSVVANHTSSGAEAAGAVIGGGLVSGFLGFVGFFLGVVFLVIGLLVGRDKQVVIVQVPAGQTPPMST
jgi:hypothetical protein